MFPNQFDFSDFVMNFPHLFLDIFVYTPAALSFSQLKLLSPSSSYLSVDNKLPWKRLPISPHFLFEHFKIFDIKHDEDFFHFVIQKFGFNSELSYFSRLKNDLQDSMKCSHIYKTNLFEGIAKFCSFETINTFIQNHTFRHKKIGKNRNKSKAKFKSFNRNQKKLEKVCRFHCLKKISKLSLSKRLNIPYHQLSNLIRNKRREKDTFPFSTSYSKKWNITDADLEDFLRFFDKHKQKEGGLAKLHSSFVSQNSKFSQMPKSSFYYYFLQNCGISSKIKKYTSKEKDPEGTMKKRLIYLDMFLRLMKTEKYIYFFDESTFEMHGKNGKSFERKGLQPTFESKLYPIKVKLLMIVSFERVECFQISCEGSNGVIIADFIKEFCMRKSKELQHCSDKVFIVLDNATKNRVKKVSSIANSPRFYLVYIIPCTPMQNFIENVFNVLKRRISEVNFDERFLVNEGHQKETNISYFKSDR